MYAVPQSVIKVKKPLHKSKVGQLLSYQTFTGKYKIRYEDNKVKDIDLNRVKYSIVSKKPT